MMMNDDYDDYDDDDEEKRMKVLILDYPHI